MHLLLLQSGGSVERAHQEELGVFFFVDIFPTLSQSLFKEGFFFCGRAKSYCKHPSPVVHLVRSAFHLLLHSLIQLLLNAVHISVKRRDAGGIRLSQAAALLLSYLSSFFLCQDAPSLVIEPRSKNKKSACLG